MKNHKNKVLIFAFIVLIFLALRLPAVTRTYHQDEYKWVYFTHPEITAPGTVPHPPLAEFLYTKIGPIIGDNNFRFIPLGFSIINLFLIFYLVRAIASTRAAFWASFLFAVSSYSIIASLMVDTDGGIMAFFFLLLAIGYLKLKNVNYKLKSSNWKWLILMVVGAVGGFFIKISALLPIFALFLDFLIEKGIFSDKKKIAKYLGFGALGILVLAALLFISQFIFPFFKLQYSIGYWEHFWTSSSFLNRGWMQTFIQFVKSILYTSPLLLLPAFFADREIWRKTRPFFFFVFVGVFFYLFAFDFSIGALDRYFQFLVVPLCVISGIVFAKFVNKEGEISKKDIILALIIAIAVFSLQFVGHFVPPLHPKAEWISRFVSLRWNFLYPFTGGSGPLGFYVSFLFVALIWILSLISIVMGFAKPHLRKVSVLVLLILGLVYNAVFAEEYLFGKINGSAPGLVVNATEFIKNNPDIKKVTVYNDNGGYDIQKIGKYRKRLYVDPSFDVNVKTDTLNKYKEHYLEINIPRIDPNSIYRRYLDSCKVIYKQTDKSISATVYDCSKASI
jgi:hypothetical protein